MDFSIEGKIYYKGQLTNACIGIEDGKIKAIKKILKAEKHFDFGNKLILPTGIDVHVHFRDLQQSYKEDFFSGSVQAIYGGITAVMEMPNTVPPTTTISGIKEKLEVAKRSAIDYGIYCGLNEKNKVEELAKYCTAFKVFLASREENFSISFETLKNKLKEIEKANKVVAIHSEDKELIRENPKNLKEHFLFRKNAEESAIEKVINLQSKAKIHFCHVSAKEGVELLKNTNYSSEVCPHHLLLNSEMELKSFGKVVPPLREKEDNSVLWDALNKGIIKIISSDHAPHTIDEKENFETAPNGFPGVETMFPLMVYEMKKGRITLQRLINAISELPSELFNFNKGEIEVGRDADFVVFDLNKEKKIKAEKLHAKVGWTPYENFYGIFPAYVFLRGNVVLEDEVFCGKMGMGEYVE